MGSTPRHRLALATVTLALVASGAAAAPAQARPGAVVPDAGRLLALPTSAAPLAGDRRDPAGGSHDGRRRQPPRRGPRRSAGPPARAPPTPRSPRWCGWSTSSAPRPGCAAGARRRPARDGRPAAQRGHGAAELLQPHLARRPQPLGPDPRPGLRLRLGREHRRGLRDPGGRDDRLDEQRRPQGQHPQLRQQGPRGRHRARRVVRHLLDPGLRYAAETLPVRSASRAAQRLGEVDAGLRAHPVHDLERRDGVGPRPQR